MQVTITLCACTFDPKYDANGIQCLDNGSCPPGYQCAKGEDASTGVCCNRKEQSACLSPALGDGGVEDGLGGDERTDAGATSSVDAATTAATGGITGSSGADGSSDAIGCGVAGQPTFTYSPISGVPQAVNDLGCLIDQEQRDVVTPGGDEANPGFSAADQQAFDSSAQLSQIVEAVTSSPIFAAGVTALEALPTNEQSSVLASYAQPLFPTWAMNGVVSSAGTTTAGYAVEQAIATALANAVRNALGLAGGALDAGLDVPADTATPGGEAASVALGCTCAGAPSSSGTCEVTGTPGAEPSDGAPGPCPTGYQLVWSDEFDGPAGSAVDATKWVFDTGNGSGGWGNSELEYYRDGAANAALDGNGNLVITAKLESYDGFSYTSARLKTQGLASWTYGHIEARIELPYGQGLWPAFWMLGNDISSDVWPSCGEIDIMENVGKEPSINHGSLHMPEVGTASDDELTCSVTLESGKLSGGFHVYAVDWSPSAIQFSFDGNVYETQTPASATGRVWEFDQPFFILLNVAVGGNFPGAPDSTTVFPQTMTVDYVRVCQ
ncbi:MAG: family 16 glycosylhydrolase [Polyangia bacterium]